MTFNGASFDFIQCENDMPNLTEIKRILYLIRRFKPSFIVEIGTGSLVAGLADKIVPVLSNGTMHSLIESSAARYQTIARTLTDEEKRMLPQLGITEDNIIFSMFTSKVREKTGTVSRQMLGLPENAIAAALIGNRLSEEVTPELMSVMMKTIDNNDNLYYIMFGGVSTYDKLTEGYLHKDHIINYGPTNDTIAVFEQCDLYLNPPRVGGGMSAIEAMACGLPAISTSYGDGGVVLGKDFWVDSLGSFADEIQRYINDKEYYDSKRRIALERGRYLQDSGRVFTDTVNEFLKRIDMQDQ
ncbi:MAG: glycosyltransferase [Lachnospiraceae bacterium]|nr:glycosyltransferase [Lachnospiraceae bacterium]MEE3460566.1 glycosyltransferase [Lachnospiraceae bacterium]